MGKHRMVRVYISQCISCKSSSGTLRLLQPLNKNNRICSVCWKELHTEGGVITSDANFRITRSKDGFVQWYKIEQDESSLEATE